MKRIIRHIKIKSNKSEKNKVCRREELMKISKMIDGVKDGIDEAKLKVVDVVDKAELDKHAKKLGVL